MRCVAALLVLAMAMAGCGSATTASSADGSAPSAGPAGDAPFGTVDAVGGGQIDGADLAGHDLALWFWAPW